MRLRFGVMTTEGGDAPSDSSELDESGTVSIFFRLRSSIKVSKLSKVKTEKVCQKLRNKLVRGQAVIWASVQGSHTYGYGTGHVDNII